MSGQHSTRPGLWSEPGPDYCEFCQHAFCVEIGYYCAECDRPICPLCVMTVRGRHAVFCPECNAGGDA